MREQIADLIAERDALAERVQVLTEYYEAGEAYFRRHAFTSFGGVESFNQHAIRTRFARAQAAARAAIDREADE